MNWAAAGDGSSAGPLGLLIVVVIGVATALLIRNMNSRLRRLPKNFDEPTSPPPDEPDDASGPTAGV